MEIILQYINVLNQHAVHLKLTNAVCQTDFNTKPNTYNKNVDNKKFIVYLNK